MTSDASVSPIVDSWVAAIHASEGDYEPLGGGVVIDNRRILTCAHVITEIGMVRDQLWVAFPKADVGSDTRRRVAKVVMPDEFAPVKDLAVLVLAEIVPSGVAAAPLRCPKSGDLADRKWWAFGFAHRDPVGNSANGFVGAALAYGWIRLDARSPLITWSLASAVAGCGHRSIRLWLASLVRVTSGGTGERWHCTRQTRASRGRNCDGSQNSGRHRRLARWH